MSVARVKLPRLQRLFAQRLVLVGRQIFERRLAVRDQLVRRKITQCHYAQISAPCRGQRVLLRRIAPCLESAQARGFVPVRDGVLESSVGVVGLQVALGMAALDGR